VWFTGHQGRNNPALAGEVLQIDMTLKLQVKIKRPEFSLDGDDTRLFENEFQWLITRLAKKLPSRTDVNWGLKSFLELPPVVLDR